MNYDLADKLKKAAEGEVPRVDLWKSIEPQLREEGNQRTVWGRPRAVAAALGLVAIALLAAAITPQGRALAQGIIDRIGNITFLREAPAVFEDPGAESQLPGLTQDEAQAREGGSGAASDEFQDLPEDQQAAILDWVTWDESDTAEKAEAILGGRVLQARTLPDGYALEHIEATQTEYGVRVAYSTYYLRDAEGEVVSPLLLTQTSLPENAPEGFGDWQVGEGAVITDTTVRGLPGKYVQGAEIAIVPQDILSWSEDGFDFSIIIESGSLELEELQRIAGGLE